MRKTITAGAILALAGTAFAGDLDFLGDTTGGPTFNRPDSLSSLSGFATDVAWEATQIGVSADGDYSVLSDQTNFGLLWDGYLLVYENGFDAANPLDNLIALNDDYFGTGLPGTGVGYSGLDAVNLSSSSTYFIVQTGFGNGDAGPYQVSISGPGDIRIIPAPASLALLGLGGLAAARRRR
ncbi:MAG: PEP-CTERM sorting domain-containing protein [Phycisphaerales bacterium JB060]